MARQRNWGYGSPESPRKSIPNLTLVLAGAEHLPGTLPSLPRSTTYT